MCGSFLLQGTRKGCHWSDLLMTAVYGFKKVFHSESDLTCLWLQVLYPCLASGTRSFKATRPPCHVIAQALANHSWQLCQLHASSTLCRPKYSRASWDQIPVSGPHAEMGLKLLLSTRVGQIRKREQTFFHRLNTPQMISFTWLGKPCIYIQYQNK